MNIILKTALGLMTTLFGFIYFRDAIKKRALFSRKPWAGFFGTGLITNFFDTLGIGSFAQQTAIFKFFRLVDDRIIPGTMNVGNTIPTVLQAFIFMTVVKVDAVTLVAMSMAAPAGSVIGAGIVAKMERGKIQLGMGIGLLVIALIILAGQLNVMPVGGGLRLDGLEVEPGGRFKFCFRGPPNDRHRILCSVHGHRLRPGHASLDRVSDHDDGHGHAHGRRQRPFRHG